GLIQGVTGFGAGIVLMMFLPIRFSVIHSAGLSGIICLVLCLAMVYRYRHTISYKKVLLPAILYLFVSSISILFAKSVNQNIMKLVLGIFLIVLAIYFLLFSNNKDVEPKGIYALLCISISGVCDGLFGIGGPLMVIYFLAKTKTKEEYLGTIQFFFFVNLLYSSLFRIWNGIITVSLMNHIIFGMIGIIIGFMIANQIVDRLNADFIKKLTYILIGICGFSNVLTVLL
ncbi:MAG: sulfite exporter TauE/SafE family protein, partial [Faecalibacillus sp.]